MRLFNVPPSDDVGPADHNEPHIDYLTRTGRPAFVFIRELIEKWLSEVSHPHRRPLITRLRSRNDHQFESAFFELYLHALLRRLGCAIKFHPRAGNRGRRPDFLVTLGNNRRMLIEAITVGESSASGKAASSRLNEVYDLLNRMNVPDYFFHVQHYGELESPLPGRTLRYEIGRFLKTLDYESVRKAAEAGGLRSLPSMSFRHGNFILEISMMPVSEKHRGDPNHRPVGMLGPGEAYAVDDSTPIKSAIHQKAKRYGRLRRPLLIAVNAMGRHLDEIDVMEALFGGEQFVFGVHEGQVMSGPRMARRPDGVWLGPHGPQYRRVSAVLIVSSLLPWSVATRQPVIYHNPWARYPIAECFPEIPASVPANNNMVSREGLAVSSILDLPESWPRQAE